MRLLYLSADPGIPVFGGKGASIHVRSMIRAFLELGHEVVVASPRLEPGEDDLPPGVASVEIPAVRPRSIPTAAEVSAQIDAQAELVSALAREQHVDAIYERYSLSSCAGARTASALSLPLIVEVNAPLRLEEQRFRRLAHEDVARLAEQETFAAARLIVAVSSWLGDWLKSLGVAGDRVAVIPNPPPHDAFDRKSPRPDADPVTVGFSGSLKPWHGVETLIAGFELACARGARMRLEIIGEGPMADEVERATSRSQLIDWSGRLPHRDVLARLRGWDVGLAPYVSLDGFYFSPLKLAEYMAAGLCPVVSDVGPLPELVEHGQAGVVVAADDPEALAEALAGLERDRPRLHRLGRRAQELARQCGSWREIAARLAPVLEVAL